MFALIAVSHTQAIKQMQSDIHTENGSQMTTAPIPRNVRCVQKQPTDTL